MSEKSIPWAGKVLGDAGPYDFDEWTKIWRDIFGVDAFVAERSGVIPGEVPTLATTAGGTPFLIGAFRAFVDGTWYESDDDTTIAITTPGGSTRPDLIVVRKSGPDQTARLTLIQGAEGDPQPPDPVQSAGSTWDMPLVKLSTTTGGVITAAPAFPMFPLGPGGRLGYSIVEILEDWIGLTNEVSGDSLVHGAYAWDVNIVTTGAVIFTQGDNSAIGMLGLNTGATINSEVELQLGRSPGARFDCGWDMDAAIRIRDIASPDEYSWAMGIRSQDAGAIDGADGIYVRAVHGVAEANWFGVVRKDASETLTDLGALSDGEWHTVEFRKEGQAGSETVQWFVDGPPVGVPVTTDVPGENDFVVPFLFNTNTDASVGLIENDFINLILKKLAANHENPDTTANRARLHNVIA
jgi:hypothetical protein